MEHRLLQRTIAAATLLCLAAVAAPSRAANLDLTAGGQLSYEGSQSVMIANDLTISLSGGTYTIHDPAEPGIGVSGSALAAGCVVVDAQTVTCPTVPIVSIAVDTQNGSDTIDLTGVIHSAMVTGGGGSDTIVGGTRDDTIVWNTFDGSDVVDGGPGTDMLFFQSGSDDGTADGNDHDNFTIVPDGAGFALYRESGNVSIEADDTEVLLLRSFGGSDTVATTGLVGTTQILETMNDWWVDTLTFDAAGLCAFTAPGWIEVPGHQPVQHSGFANTSVINESCNDDCNGFAATVGCTVNGIANQLCEGTDGDDVILGTAGADVIVGGGGQDRISAGAGDDLACGGDGNDLVEGARGNDMLLGGAGADRLRGDAGNDDLIGGDDDDDLRGDRGADDLSGGPGNDRLLAGGDRDTLQGDAGSDVIDGGAAVDTCTDSDQVGPFVRCELPS
jgi:Ca2+-binding RTX toxin-like protein